MLKPIQRRLALVSGVVLLGLVIACCAGVVLGVNGAFDHPAFMATKVEEVPLPHQAARFPGGVSLRLAMVHDVLHDRYPRHGKDYYAERNRRVKRALEELEARAGGAPKPTAEYFALLDDLGAGLDHLGKHDEAVAVLRDKLKRQEKQGLGGRALYTSFANLGTFLMHGNFGQAMAGNATAKERVREGLALIHRSIEVNPQAHFGREIWQAVLGEFLLAAIDDPQRLLHYDMIGNRLSNDVLPQGSMRHAIPKGYFDERALVRFLEHPDDGQEAAQFRIGITRVGAEEGWAKAVRTSHQKPVPFDEPVLGIIGMWRLGSGANPHFALALGETMNRVGQRHLAWCGYERAARLAKRFWPDPKIQQALVKHCRARQLRIENSLPSDEGARLREHFDTELARGQKYQQAYQKDEAERIRAGASIDDPHFHDAFYQRHGRIATPVGNVDWAQVREKTYRYPVIGAFLFGLGTFCASVLIWLAARCVKGWGGTAAPAPPATPE